ncbi:DUF1254 domain-containing protein [Monashia sp. NPDC004114]
MALGEQRMTVDYARSVARMAYLWGWPLANIHNRRVFMEQLPGPGLLAGIVPAGPPNHIGMLHDYVRPEERIVACPNQDVVYGFGPLDANLGPAVIQVPDFGDRFWVYQVVNQRTDSFVNLGKMYGTEPGHYLLAPEGWDGSVPEGIAGVFHYDTRCGVVIPRVFMDDTAEDREAVQPIVNQISVYPLADFDGTMKTTDWSQAPSFGETDAASGQEETQWVDPTTFFASFGEVLDEVPPLPGEEAMYGWFRAVLAAAENDNEIAAACREAAIEAEPVARELFEFRNYGIPVGHHWTTQRNGAEFGTDYLMRLAVGKSNIFVNTPVETTYFYQDLDTDGARLNGAHTYAVRFDRNHLPPVRGFWSLTVYNQHHFFHPNDLDRYSLGTKNKNLTYGEDGSLTLTIGGQAPEDGAQKPNWLPAPSEEFSVYLRTYWPDDSILDGSWAPPAVERVRTA